MCIRDRAYTGPGVIHRDFHDHNGYLYIVCDEGSASTLQIVDISNLPNSVNTVYDSNSLLNKVHNIFIDTATTKLYACATGEAMEVFDLSNPDNPVLINTYNDVGHVHDAYVKNDTAFLNCGNDGLRIMDYSMVNSTSDSPIELASFTSYPDAGYNHSGWLSDDGNIYAMQDENHGYDVKILDVSDFSNISVLATFSSGVDPNSMAHNGIIKDNLLYIAYYHDGLRIFDISDPYNPNQIVYYDTYTPASYNSYKGAWGVYPYLPSGNIISSDINSGPGGSGRLLIYGRDFQQASFLSGNVTNSTTGLPINNATIQIVSTSLTTTTNLLGVTARNSNFATHISTHSVTQPFVICPLHTKSNILYRYT